MGRRITRKQLKEDEFVSAMDVVIHWFSDNWRPVAAGAGAVVVLAVLVWTALSLSDSRAEKASYQLRRAVAAYQEARDGGTADLEQARSGLQAVVDQFGSTDQADMARIYLAQIDLAKGDVDRARNALVQLVANRRGDAVGRLATLDLIHLRVASGQAAEVAKELEAMVVGSDTSLPRDLALYELAELYIKEQDTARAKEYFQKLVDEFPESAFQSQAQQRLNELG